MQSVGNILVLSIMLQGYQLASMTMCCPWNADMSRVDPFIRALHQQVMSPVEEQLHLH